jgi:hypothetical protein
MNDPIRDVVFISHATPEDNEFVKWLGARLIGLGYNVWADVFELKGGSPFWRNIEEAIRERAIKVIYVASTSSVDPSRTGVRDELSAAAGVGKSLNDPAFIIPVRLDKVDFNNFPIQVIQLNAIDFSAGWGSKLSELVDTIEVAAVPVDHSKVDEHMRFWKERTTRDTPTVEDRAELLLTNLLPIDELPGRVNFFNFGGPNTEIRTALDATGVPYYRFGRLVISFASMAEIQSLLLPQYTVSIDKSVELERFLDGPKGNETSPLRQEAKNILNHLLRRHVERYLMSRGLKAYEASRGIAFYFPVGMIADEKVRYVTPDGRTTWKAITGRSEKLGVYWHLSMLVNIDLGPPAFVRFKPYVCFSEDGQTPIGEPKRMIALRRRFCRGWWNRHWRQLQQAFIAFLSSGKAEIVVNLDGPEQLMLRGALFELQGVRRLVGDVELDDDPEEPDESTDDFDGDDAISGLDDDEGDLI